jgi:hypothetical protein
MTLVMEGSLMLTGILKGHPQEYQVRQLQRSLSLPDIAKPIVQPHMTVLTYRDLKPLQKRTGKSYKEFREWMERVVPTLPPAPDVFINTSDVYTATGLAEKTFGWSCFLLLSDNLSFLDWRDEIMDALGVLLEDIDISRPFHISIANRTGPHDSVAKPTKEESE